jgi:hypothetical protein
VAAVLAAIVMSDVVQARSALDAAGGRSTKRDPASDVNVRPSEQQSFPQIAP